MSPAMSRSHHAPKPQLEMIDEYRFSAKYMRTSKDDNPNKVIPSRFTINWRGEKVTLTYHSLILEGPKSLVCRYANRNGSRSSFPQRVIVKYQLKFQAYAWSARLRNNIQKRYLDPDKGDVLCSRLPSSDRLCPYFGTYCLVANPRVETPDRWDAYARNPSVPPLTEVHSDEGFVIQIFHEVNGCDLYSFLSEDNTHEICKAGSRHHMVNCLQIMADIFEGIGILHRAGIYHGDLKPENVMLYQTKAPDEGHQHPGASVRATVIDFDFAACIEDDRIKRGTPRYLSPEYIEAYRGHSDLPSLGRYGCEFDIWAIGAIMWTLFYGSRRGEKLYFTSYSTDELKSATVTSTILRTILVQEDYDRYLLKRCGRANAGSLEDKIRALVLDLLAFSPMRRPTALDGYERTHEILALFRPPLRNKSTRKHVMSSHGSTRRV